MFRRLLKEESGYSLVEVIVSIFILAAAIIPMVGMFDMGLNSATRGSNYDKARTLANLKMEEAKSLPFADVENNFPETGIATPYEDGSAWFTEPDNDFANFEYRVEKQYMEQPPIDPAVEDPTDPSEEPWVEDTSGTPTDLIRITVIVGWGEDNIETYSTFGLVAE